MVHLACGNGWRVLAVAGLSAALIGCQAKSGQSNAAKTDAPEKPARAAATARPESDGQGKGRLDSAAMDLQTLFDEMKTEDGGMQVSREPMPSQRSADSRSPRTVSHPTMAPDLGVALDVEGDHAPTPAPDADPARGLPSGLLVAGTTAVAPEETEAGAETTDPRAAAESAALGGALATERPGAATAPVERPPMLRVGTVALCQRVEGFGRFTPLPSNKFIAGRPALMIVYTELDEFARREELVGEAGVQTQHVVEVSQQIDLLFDADGSRQFAAPEQTIRDASRTARRDFFVVQRLELPRNLSVGKYNLKLILRDKISGAEAEKVVPIVIVADPNLLRSADQRDSGIITPEMTEAERAIRAFPSTARPAPARRRTN